MAIRCLSCDLDVPDDLVVITKEVLVCVACKNRLDEFLKLVAGDLKNIDKRSNEALRKGLLQSEFRRSWIASGPLDRIALLIRLMQKPCPTSQIPPSSPPTSSSGEPLPPHVALLTAVGRKGSNSPTE